MAGIDDEKMMRRALRLARRGRGRVEPNPMVGAVVVGEGRILGEGYHRQFGGPHAEVAALSACQESPAGARMYVTLEPCCHVGKTGPCTEAIIEAGLAEVVVACEDPSAKVAGKGVEHLRQAGIRVSVGVCGREARRLNAGFFKVHRRGRPFVMLKWAQSLDGKIGGSGEDSGWISGEKSRRFVHKLRRESQAILVGINTALADDPLLTARPGIRGRQALRIVVDSRLRLGVGSLLVRTVGKAPLMIAAAKETVASKREAVRRLEEAGAEVCAVGCGGGLVELAGLLDELGRREILNLMVEGGAEILRGFIEGRLADEICVFVCPKTIGGHGTAGPVGEGGPEDIAEKLGLGNARFQRFDDDVMVRGDVAGVNYLDE